MTIKNILIADRYQISRLGISTVVQQTLPGCKVVVAQTMDEVTRCLAAARYDLLIMEPNIEGYQDEMDIYNLLSLQAALPIMIYTDDQNKFIKINHLAELLAGYLSKEASLEELSNAIVNISKGAKYFPNMDSVKGSNLVKSRDRRKGIKINKILSFRECEVANYLVKGSNASEISKLLGVNRTTVSTYKKRIFDKIGVDNLADLVHIL